VKLLRIALVLMTAIAVTAIPGCDRAYSFNFKNEQSLGNDEGTWYMSDYFAMIKSVSPSIGGEYTFTADGLFLNGKIVSCPFMFSGDISYEVVFTLTANEAHWVNFGLNLGDGTWKGSAESEMHIEFYNVGGDEEFWQIVEHGADAMVPPVYFVDSPLASLRRDGRNVFRLVKKGDHITVRMNGSIFAEFDLEGYESEWFAPGIEARNPIVVILSATPSVMPLPEYGFFLESVKVTYPEGGIDDTPLPV
jgi:hypothetical protein